MEILSGYFVSITTTLGFMVVLSWMRMRIGIGGDETIVVGEMGNQIVLGVTDVPIASDLFDTSDPTNYYRRCIMMVRPGVVEPYRFPTDKNTPRFYDSIFNKYEVGPCKTDLTFVRIDYNRNGTLPRGYVEALKIIYRNNQTLLVMHVCGIDFSRCPDRIKALRTRYRHDLQIRYNYNHTLVDLHICVIDVAPCPYVTRPFNDKCYVNYFTKLISPELFP